MAQYPPRGLFITGVNTEVGKTYVAALLARRLRADGLRVGVYKPAASGGRVEEGVLLSDDASALWEAAGKPLSLADVCPQSFATPLAPHLAARLEGSEIDARLLREGLAVWTGQCDIVLVEGSGGLMSPVSDDEYVADLAYDFGYPLLVVAPNTLGVINQTLQTLITAVTFRKGLEIAGVILNDCRPNADDASAASNAEQLAMRCTPPLLAHVRHGATALPSEVAWNSLV